MDESNTRYITKTSLEKLDTTPKLKKMFQRRSQNPNKHLRWRAL